MKPTSIAVALCLTLCGGCATRRGAKTTMVTGLGATLAGAVIGAVAYDGASDRPEPEYAAVAFGGPVILFGTTLIVGSLINLIVLDAWRVPEPAAGPVAQPAAAPMPDVRVFRCTALEIDAGRGDAPALDVGLEALRDRFAQAPYAGWNQFRVVTKVELSLAEGRPALLPLELGAASITATGLAPSRIRLATAIDDALGQRHLYPAADVGHGAFALVGPILVDQRPRTLALTCD